jgi:hypothetical protein
MIVITSADRRAGITGQETLACETFTTIAKSRGKGPFCFNLKKHFNTETADQKP